MCFYFKSERPDDLFSSLPSSHHLSLGSFVFKLNICSESKYPITPTLHPTTKMTNTRTRAQEDEELFFGRVVLLILLLWFVLKF